MIPILYRYFKICLSNIGTSPVDNALYINWLNNINKSNFPKVSKLSKKASVFNIGIEIYQYFILSYVDSKL